MAVQTRFVGIVVDLAGLVQVLGGLGLVGLLVIQGVCKYWVLPGVPQGCSLWWLVWSRSAVAVRARLT